MDRIQQVLLNLGTNAMKFVPKSEGKIKIISKVVAAPEDNEHTLLSISVTDNGPGISKEDQTKLF